MVNSGKKGSKLNQLQLADINKKNLRRLYIFDLAHLAPTFPKNFLRSGARHRSVYPARGRATEC